MNEFDLINIAQIKLRFIMTSNINSLNNNRQMGSSGTKIQTLKIPASQINPTNQKMATRSIPPFRKFSQQYKKVSNRNLSYIISISSPVEESFSIESVLYKELVQAFEEKTKDIIIQGALVDGEGCNSYVFLTTNTQNKQTILIRPFKDFQSHIIGSILCEVHYSEVIKNFNCPNLHHLQEAFIVETGIDSLQEPNNYVLMMEPIGTNLSEIISYRRSHNWEWTEKQFDRLVSDLVDGLSVLHEKGISHNDIRPFTIYYSIQKNCYLIGAYGFCMKDLGSQNKKADVYSLGQALLSAFYLYEPINERQIQQLNKKYQGKYDSFDVIQEMLAPAERRKSISQIKAHLSNSNYQFENMGNLIESLRHKNRPDINGFAKTKLVYGEGYQRLGLWNQWKKQYEEAFQILEPTYDPYHKAEVLKELAVIDNCRGEYQVSSENAKKACTIYRSLGYKELDEGNSGLAQTYFQKGLSCSKYFEFQNDLDLARTLQGLSEVHAEKNEYTLSKTLITEASNVAGKSQGKQSFEYCRLKTRQAKLESEFGQFEDSEKILNDCLAIARKKEQINPTQSNKLRAEVQLQRGRNFMKRASYEPDKQKKETYLAKGQQYALQSIQIYEKIDQDQHLKLAEIVTVLGQIQFKRENYSQAKTDFQKSLDMIKFTQAKNSGIESREHADALCHIGSCETFLGEHDQAIKSYDGALKIYKKIYGSDHNRYSGMAIGNLARVYTNLKEKVKARDCLKCATNILGDVLGKQDPDYQHFKTIEDRLDSV